MCDCVCVPTLVTQCDPPKKDVFVCLCAGIAPNAKISFFDFGLTDSGGNDVLVSPGDCVDVDCTTTEKGDAVSIFALHYNEVRCMHRVH